MDPTKAPAMYPPQGVTYDFNAPNPLITFGNLAALTICCLSLCTILLLLQLWTKRFLLHGLVREDYAAVLAWTANIICIIYMLLVLIIKVAVLLQYLRIFVPIRNMMWYLTWLLIGINFTSNLGITFAFIFQCVPRQKLWKPSLPGRCIDLGRVLGCVASLKRLVVALEILKSKDLTYLLAKKYLWAAQRNNSLAEVTSGLVCCCLPCLPKLCRHLSGQVKSSFGRSGASNSNRISHGRQQPEPDVELAESKGAGKDGTGQPRVVVKEYSVHPDAQSDTGDNDESGYIRKTVEIQQSIGD
ncbi:MAG: hypothetical protein Q9182_003124 [Xanthomendoza sp. 2 TL-2023]